MNRTTAPLRTALLGAVLLALADVDLKMAVRPLINLRPGETPQTVMGWYATADDYYRSAKLYVEKQEAHAAGRGEAPEVDERLEALAAVIRGDVMVHAHSHYPSEIMMVMRLAPEVRLHRPTGAGPR